MYTVANAEVTQKSLFSERYLQTFPTYLFVARRVRKLVEKFFVMILFCLWIGQIRLLKVSMRQKRFGRLTTLLIFEK